MREAPRGPSSTARPRARARGLVSTLLGVLAGGGAALAIAAAGPVVGRTGASGAMAAVPMVDAGREGRSRGEAAPPGSAVIAPAVDSGVDRAPRSGSDRP